MSLFNSSRFDPESPYSSRREQHEKWTRQKDKKNSDGYQHNDQECPLSDGHDEDDDKGVR